MRRLTESWPPKSRRAKAAWVSFAIAILAGLIELCRALLGEPSPVDIHIHQQEQHDHGSEETD